MAVSQTTPRLFTCHHCGVNFTGRKRKYCSALCRQREKTQRDGFVPSGRKRLQPTPIIDGKRQCLKCGEVKAVDLFAKTNNSKSGRQSTCSECEKKRASKHAETRSLEARQKERAKIAAKQGRTYTPGKRTLPLELLQSRLTKINAREAWVYWMRTLASDEWIKAYYESTGKPWNNPNLSNTEYYRIRYRIDPEFNLRERMRNQVKKQKKRARTGEDIRSAFSRGGRCPSLEKEFGYTIPRLREHLERQFTKGMTWDRFLTGEIHIDHIHPQSEFDLSDDDQWRKCWCLSNLRPMWGGENCAKGNRIHYLL